jgi:hypothetical protein
MRRKLSSAVLSFCALVAFGSYASVLAGGRTAWLGASEPVAASQAFGADAIYSRGAISEPGLHSIAIGTLPDSASTWVLMEPPAMPNARHVIVVFAADDIEFLKSGARARIWLDGIELASIRPPANLSGYPFPFENEPVSLAPRATQGYRFALRGTVRCRHDVCRLSLTLHQAAWRIYRVAIEVEEYISETGAPR